MNYGGDHALSLCTYKMNISQFCGPVAFLLDFITMTPEEKSLLERTHKLSEDNNKILRSMRRTGRIGMILHALYWVIILAVSFGAYYFIQPYVTMMLDLISDQPGMTAGVTSDMSQVQSATNSLRELLQ